MFRIFDPVSWFEFSFNWLFIILLCFIFLNHFWLRPNKINVVGVYLSRAMTNNLIKNVSEVFPLGRFVVYLRCLISIGLVNFFGLIPYIFTSTRHLRICLRAAFPVWFGHVILAWMKTPVKMFSHLIPLGTPRYLIPFMVVIEVISRIIRPITLSVRLTANIIAGHLLIRLLSEAVTFWTFRVVIPLLVILCLLETAVALIQAYVFSILSVLYIAEVDSPSLNSYD